MMAFIYPIKLLKLPPPYNDKIVLCTIFLIGAFFGHRTAVLYIFLGVSLVVINHWLSHNRRTSFILN